MAITAAGVTAAGSLLGGLGSAVSGLFGGKSKGVSTYDQLQVPIQYGKAFKGIAKDMGVSRHALLGAQMPSGSSGGMIRMKPDIGQSMARMGQDVQRGVQSYLAVKEADDNAKLKSAQARLYNAQATNLLNQQTQRPPGISEENLQSDYLTQDQQLKARGVAREDQVTLTKNGEVRHYPSQEIQDYISESMIGEGLYMTGKAQYINAMQKGHRGVGRYRAVYNQAKNEIEYRIGQPVRWEKTRWVVGRKPRPTVIRRKIPRQ